MYEIEKGVPFPSLRSKYPLAEMLVGDSVFLPGKTTGSMGSYISRLKPKKFICRTKTVNGVLGVRVWRTL